MRTCLPIKAIAQQKILPIKLIDKTCDALTLTVQFYRAETPVRINIDVQFNHMFTYFSHEQLSTTAGYWSGCN